MSSSHDDTERKQCLEFVDQILAESADSHASEILFRQEPERVQVFFLVDGKYEKHMTIPVAYWDLVKYILRNNYFEKDQYQLKHANVLCLFTWAEDQTGNWRLTIQRRDVPGIRRDHIEDVFRAFEEPVWDAVKSIFLAILNMALEQDHDEIRMELDGPVVDVGYFQNAIQRTNLTISSDSYDALARLIGENYLAFGFMIREFRAREYLIRLKELNEDDVAPRIVLEIEEFT